LYLAVGSRRYKEGPPLRIGLWATKRWISIFQAFIWFLWESQAAAGGSSRL
jgi:hypothetical protein